MLQYTSLSLALIVLVAYYKRATVIHHQWLAVLCTSLINHTAKNKIAWVRLLDQVLCHLNTAYCVRVLVYAPLTKWNIKIMIINGNIALYLLYVYHIGRQCHGPNEKLWHASVHLISTVAVINTINLDIAA